MSDLKFSAQIFALIALIAGSIRFGYLLAAQHLYKMDDYWWTWMIVLALILSLLCWILSIVKRARSS